ncbi:MAG: NUDIX domain-containing protein [Candidatus Rokubacteria bacterium]|nr:NUDIX domain-containing protein [Candidatus Rokubacteria bacterium]
MPRRRARPVQSAIALIERRGRLLICRRRPGGFLGGYWEFPGGKRRPGERWAACLRRELREELGVSVGRLRPLMVIRHRYLSGPIVFNRPTGRSSPACAVELPPEDGLY